MKCLCPACGRTTDIESELLEFFARCTRCGVLLRPRPPAATPDAAEDQSPAKMTARVVPVGRVREAPPPNDGQIADLLCRQPRPAPAAPPAVPVPAVVAVPPAGAYQQALRRAQLRQQQQTLGAAGVICLGVFAFLLVGTIVLKSHTGPSVAHADMIRGDLTPPHAPPAVPPQATSPR